MWWNGTDGNATLVVVTGHVSGGLSDQVGLTRGQSYGTTRVRTPASSRPRDARNAPLRYKGAKR